MPVTFIRAYRRPRTDPCPVDPQYAPPASPATTARDRRPPPLRPARGDARSSRLSPGVVIGAAPRARPSARRPPPSPTAWERGDYAGDVRPAERRRQAAHEPRAARAHLQAGGGHAHAREGPRRPASSDDTTVPVDARHAHLRHAAAATSSLPTGEREDADPGVDWRAELVYPGLRRGEKLGARRRCPPRATIQARDGTRDRQGPGPPVRPRTARLRDRRARSAPRRRSAPPSSPRAASRPARRSGLTGLEREFDERLTGTPGGVLLRRRRACSPTQAPSPGSAVRTTIDPKIQRAAVEALAGRYGGIAVVAARATARCWRSPGIAQSAPQPPGSTFKIVTLAGVLDEQDRQAHATYPVQTAATIEGVEIQNANGESCGGSLRDLLRALLQQRLRAAGRQAGRGEARRDGAEVRLQRGPGLTGAARSTIPAAGEIGDDLAVGSSAIGQGKVLATPLQMALVAATIGADGVRPTPDAAQGRRHRARARHARRRRPHDQELHAHRRDRRHRRRRGAGRRQGRGQDRHRGAAHDGQGGAAAGGHRPRTQPPPEDDTTDTDAWFAAFAPYSKPTRRRRGAARRPGRRRRHRRARGR